MPVQTNFNTQQEISTKLQNTEESTDELANFNIPEWRKDEYASYAHKRWSSQANRRNDRKFQATNELYTNQKPNNETSRKNADWYIFENNIEQMGLTGSCELSRTKNNIKESDTYVNKRKSNIKYTQNNHGVSPFGRTDNWWQFPDQFDEKLLVNNQIKVYQNTEMTSKKPTAYIESYNNKIKCTKRHIHNKGVRVSGRRFTTGVKNRKIIGDQSSYESDELYKSRTSNTQNLAKLVEINRPEMLPNTPDKHSMQNLHKNKAVSSKYK